MISYVSQLLDAFIQEEKRKIDSVEMPHMPTLGNAYEELTKAGMRQDFAIPKMLNLKVVSGFISRNGKIEPGQIDCMVVEGKGVRYGKTNEYIYEIEQVLCVFEVKKTLRKKDYRDAFGHLRNVRRIYSDYFHEKLKDPEFAPDIRDAALNYSTLTGNFAPTTYRDINKLCREEAIKFYTLVQDSLAPLTIIHGYDGYKRESGMRNAFAEILSEGIEQEMTGLGLMGIPNLATSNNYAIIKCDGNPMIVKNGNGSWVALVSTRHNPAKLILELLWTRISKRYHVRMPWNDGLEMENLKPLLVADTIVESNGESGWIYRTIKFSEKELTRDDNEQWEPFYLGKPEITAINLMCYDGTLELNSGVQEFLKSKYQVELESVVDNLMNSGFFMRNENYVTPINRETHIITNIDKTGWISVENERFDMWCKEKKIKPNYFTILLAN